MLDPQIGVLREVGSFPSLPASWYHLCHDDELKKGPVRVVLCGRSFACYRTQSGRAHHFGTISSYEEFARRVPLMDYESLNPWIERNVLTRDPVTRLIPTSGSSGGRKLIPFTTGLQHEFNAAIGP